MSSTRIEHLIDNAQAAFDRRPTDIEGGLDVEDAALLQLWKAWRLLAGAEALQTASTRTHRAPIGRRRLSIASL